MHGASAKRFVFAVAIAVTEFSWRIVITKSPTATTYCAIGNVLALGLIRGIQLSFNGDVYPAPTCDAVARGDVARGLREQSGLLIN